MSCLTVLSNDVLANVVASCLQAESSLRAINPLAIMDEVRRNFDCLQANVGGSARVAGILSTWLQLATSLSPDLAVLRPKVALQSAFATFDSARLLTHTAPVCIRPTVSFA